MGWSQHYLKHMKLFPHEKRKFISRWRRGKTYTDQMKTTDRQHTLHSSASCCFHLILYTHHFFFCENLTFYYYIIKFQQVWASLANGRDLPQLCFVTWTLPSSFLTLRTCAILLHGIASQTNSWHQVINSGSDFKGILNKLALFNNYVAIILLN